ncbi:MAG TPA: ATP-binding protein [Actinomycetes bacterium]
MIRWWRRRSLRVRLTVLSTGTLALGLAVGTTGLAVFFAHGRTQDLDRQLAAQADTVRALVDSDQLTQPLPVPPGSPVLAQVIDPAGTVLTSSAAAGRVLPLVPVQTLDQLTGAGLRTVDETGYGAGPLRVDVESATLRGTPVRVVVAASVRDVDSTLAALRHVLFLVVPLTVLAVGLAAWIAIGSALRPVEDLRRAAEAIGSRTRRQPERSLLPEPPTGDEIARLAVTLNSMLDRLSAASAQQREFAADAAHELRSPLSALITELEVGLASGDPAGWSDVAASALVDARRLATIVDDLLLLTRNDGTRPLRLEQVDLAAVVDSFRPADDDTEVAQASAVLVRTPDEAVIVQGDQAAIERAVRNLVDNARRHARSTVEIALERRGTDAVVVVEDDGPGIPADQLERVFDRFHRIDEGRSRDDGGAGLGLAIVRGIARSHGGEVTLEPRAAGGLVARLTLPTIDD